jgi:hypothetical protein
MKNVTLSMRGDLLQAGRAHAARRRTTLNQLIRDLLEAEVRADPKARARDLFASMDAGRSARRGYRWSREDAYL